MPAAIVLWSVIAAAAAILALVGLAVDGWARICVVLSFIALGLLGVVLAFDSRTARRAFTALAAVAGFVAVVQQLVGASDTPGAHISPRTGTSRTIAGPQTGSSPAVGYSPSQRRSYSCSRAGLCESGVDHVTFNSYINAPNYGDERPFVDVKREGSRGPFHDTIRAKAGDHLRLRIYIDNNADEISARGTTVSVFVQSNRNTRLVVAASITADNAQPRTVSDTVLVQTKQPARLSLHRPLIPKVEYRLREGGEFVTKRLPVSSPSPWYMTANLGLWEPGFAMSGLVIVAVDVI